MRGVRRLACLCPNAQAAGLQPGQTLTQARSLCPALVVADAEPEQDAAALAALAQWATRFTPLAAACAPDTLWLDIGGCAHLWGGEVQLAEALASRLQRWGLVVRWAVAGTAGAAHALARHAHCSIIPHQDNAAAQTAAAQTAATQAAATLGPLPIEALRLDAADAAGLRRLGLKTIAALARLPRAELAARFGPAPGLRLDQAHGTLAEAISWPPPPPDWSEQLRCAEPILTTEGCGVALARLAAALCARLAAQRLGGRQFVAAFRRLDGSDAVIGIATAAAVNDPAYLHRLLAERLDGMDPGFGIECATLSAPSIEAARSWQGDFTASAAGQAQQRLLQMIDALANRLQGGRLWRLAPRDSHIPEQAARPVPPADRIRGPAWADDPAAPRPIRLLQRPEPVDVTAVLPDEPPLQFRWRGALHRVRAATGPERIAGEWWATQPGGTRDYYNVEDVAGGRFWMFRAASGWFLHGLFG